MSTRRREVLEAVGREIARARRTAGWSQEELAHQCGLHRTYVGGVERGERNPTIMSLLVICDALGLSVAELATAADI
ncbi:MAG TPA: helix-turn-helix transcriptional regulator [Actinomycetota bacterium]|nr:helix-turn-helix transcriptional regulator [Actinomycetota bacterium]